MRFLYLLLSILILPQLGFGQNIKENALLWEISGNGLKKSSYLFGTIHVACQGEVELRPELQKAFEKTDQLVLELDMDDPKLMEEMMKSSLSKDGKTVSEKLGPELSAKVDSLLMENMGMPMSMFDNLNLTTISVQLGMIGMGCPLDLGYDMMFLEEAKANGKEILGLETIQQQIEVLLSQTEEEAIQAISYMVNNFDETKIELQNLTSAYRNQEIQKLYDLSKESYEDPNYPKVKIEDFLDNRNVQWIPIIEEQIKLQPSFIAIGAAHLAGDNGLIHLLRKQGYQLKPIKS